MRDNLIQTKDLSMMVNDDRTLFMGNTLLVTDNLECEPIADMKDRVDRFVKRFPMKLSVA